MTSNKFDNMTTRKTSSKKKRWNRYLSTEIGIEYKACLYFFCMLFFYCCTLCIKGVYQASILVLAEMILLNYLLGYLQTYVLNNFDESEHFTWRTLCASILCTGIYGGCSYLFNWFDQNVLISMFFSAYVLLAYVCMHWINRKKRQIDTNELNHNLNDFKMRRDS